MGYIYAAKPIDHVEKLPQRRELGGWLSGCVDDTLWLRLNLVLELYRSICQSSHMPVWLDGSVRTLKF